MDLETAFDLLSNDCRRAIVAVLAGTDGVTREELTARLLACGIGPDEGNPQRTRRRLRIALHHNHLPRLVDAGAVEYDGQTVVPTPELDALADHLDRSADGSRAGSAVREESPEDSCA
jgi:hypothetical protein